MWLTVRELIGWMLALFGLVLIWFVFRLAVNRAILEAAALSFPAMAVFRVGMSFVRLAMAGRIAAGLNESAAPLSTQTTK